MRKDYSLVDTTYFATATAVLRGSAGSKGGGAREVLTLQNLHPRVQVSPINIMVAVAVPYIILIKT